MSAHRSLCPRGRDLDLPMRIEWDELSTCLCPLIDAVEALVRERIVAGLKAMPGEPCSDLEDDSQIIWREDAIAIALGGGSDG